MRTLKFKTNIIDQDALHKITPFLDDPTGSFKWTIDISHPDKILTAQTNSRNPAEIIEILKSQGYWAELVIE
jgi:hypothetical protein